MTNKKPTIELIDYRLLRQIEMGRLREVVFAIPDISPGYRSIGDRIIFKSMNEMGGVEAEITRVDYIDSDNVYPHYQLPREFNRLREVLRSAGQLDDIIEVISFRIVEPVAWNPDIPPINDELRRKMAESKGQTKICDFFDDYLDDYCSRE